MARIVRRGRGIQGGVSVLMVVLKLESIQFLPKLFSVCLQIFLSGGGGGGGTSKGGMDRGGGGRITMLW